MLDLPQTFSSPKQRCCECNNLERRGHKVGEEKTIIYSDHLDSAANEGCRFCILIKTFVTKYQDWNDVRRVEVGFDYNDKIDYIWAWDGRETDVPGDTIRIFAYESLRSYDDYIIAWNTTVLMSLRPDLSVYQAEPTRAGNLREERHLRARQEVAGRMSI